MNIPEEKLVLVSHGWPGPCNVCHNECMCTKYEITTPFWYKPDRTMFFSNGDRKKFEMFNFNLWVCSEECLTLWLISRL